ncbi:MAG: DNA-binding protein WhiA [Nitriliruptorales bacterium]|nr:DNA-binding protein WhiA [Nitriliruptorales bacterium]
MGRSGGLTGLVRREIAALPLADAPRRSILVAELSGMQRAGGILHRRGDGPLDLMVTTREHAVARRAFRVAKAVTGRAPEVATRFVAPQGQLFRVLVPDAGEVLDADALLASPRWLDGARDELGAFLRGALLVRGSVSRPDAAVHAELPFSPPDVVAAVAAATARRWQVHVHADRDRGRVVLKSAEAVGALLVEIGATQAFLEFDRGRLRRELRRAATRLANADGANVARATGAASSQVNAIRRLLGTDLWSSLDEPEQDTALARLANPDLTLAEIGALVDPPVAKATVHRRLARVQALVADTDGAAPT